MKNKPDTSARTEEPLDSLITIRQSEYSSMQEENERLKRINENQAKEILRLNSELCDLIKQNKNIG